MSLRSLPRHHQRWLLPASLAVIGAVAACGGEATAAAPPQVARTPPQETHPVELPQPPPAPTLDIHVKLGADLKRCDVKEPHFFYNKSVVRPEDVPELRHLAACLTTKPFSDVNLRLVGHADPRGSAAYNDKLAMARAEYVKKRLVAYGVPGERIAVETRGAKDAIGNTPNASYGYDRRVDIVQLEVIRP